MPKREKRTRGAKRMKKALAKQVINKKKNAPDARGNKLKSNTKKKLERITNNITGRTMAKTRLLNMYNEKPNLEAMYK